MPHQTLINQLSFIIHPLQLRAFNHIMSSMTTKSVIYGVIDLRKKFNGSKKGKKGKKNVL